MLECVMGGVVAHLIASALVLNVFTTAAASFYEPLPATYHHACDNLP